MHQTRIPADVKCTSLFFRKSKWNHTDVFSDEDDEDDSDFDMDDSMKASTLGKKSSFNKSDGTKR